MIRYQSEKQLTLAEFDWPFQVALDEDNRWVKLSECIPWDEMAEGYYQGMSKNKGRPGKDARLVIGAVIIKHKLCLSDEETVAQIQENPYLQYFVGLPGYQQQAPFAPSLFVDIRKRMGNAVFEVFQQALIDAVDALKSPRRSTACVHADTSTRDKDDEPPSGGSPTSDDAPDDTDKISKGKLILDATVAPQAIRYPTDLSLLNEAREFSEQIIDRLFPYSGLAKKPRTYREQARRAYLAMAKQRRPSGKARRRGIKQQLQYLRRNLKHIQTLLAQFPEGEPLPLPNWLLHRYWVIQHLYEQQCRCIATRPVVVIIALSASASRMCGRSCEVSRTSRWSLVPSSVSA
jgi:hypothetical protein